MSTLELFPSDFAEVGNIRPVSDRTTVEDLF